MRHLIDIGGFANTLIYRGQANAAWKLIPSLYRMPAGEEVEDMVYTFQNGEDRILELFFRRAAMILPQIMRSPLRDRMIAQHYGVPTQLLDWTLDPMLAIYFAVEDRNDQEDAALFYIGAQGDPVQTLEPAFPYEGDVVRIIPPVMDERIRAQRSVFTLQSYGSKKRFTPLDDRPPHDFGFGKVIIPALDKVTIRFELMFKGIDAATVYPGLQGIGAAITSMLFLQGFGNES